MDELTLLRKMHSNVPEASDDALRRGRAALFNRINQTSLPAAHRPKRKARARWAGAGIGLIGVAALVVGLVVSNVFGVAGWRGSAEPAAAEVLHSAALASIQNSDPVLAPGQYLLVATTAVGGATMGISDSVSGSFLYTSNESMYVPADRNDEWVRVWSLIKPYKTFGPTSERAAKEFWAGEVSGKGADFKGMMRARNGAFFSPEDPKSPDRLAALPRDPSALLDHIHTLTIGQGSSPDGEALVWIADTLRSGVVPAELRAALYNAAAMIPGVEITEKQANLNGAATGIAIGRLETVNGIRQDLIIDPNTGQLIGERQVLTRGYGPDYFPVGTVIGWTAITTTVVDSAPEGGS
jgi:RNA polymerase sigma-70 factor (ECF subfamily)